ncbi:hypothetical protein GCM10009069_29420 [Algimonas arctica]|uniref:Uncharacterized protein n=1 Tax=Algimonas arctica TaxID=1479486 RepID=A0A8J3CT31_9PROT|nr:hypothetical protein [Algimonas arctica]GHB04993.1 hypothetical protein GCM10009069_29420 [Algimonas arctica]
MGDNSTPDASKFSKHRGNNANFGKPKNTLSRGAKDQLEAENKAVSGETETEKSKKALLLAKLQANLDSNKAATSEKE